MLQHSPRSVLGCPLQSVDGAGYPLPNQLYFEAVWNVVKIYLNDLKTIFFLNLGYFFKYILGRKPK